MVIDDALDELTGPRPAEKKRSSPIAPPPELP
jgi:hypothetical protein